MLPRASLTRYPDDPLAATRRGAGRGSRVRAGTVRRTGRPRADAGWCRRLRRRWSGQAGPSRPLLLPTAALPRQSGRRAPGGEPAPRESGRRAPGGSAPSRLPAPRDGARAEGRGPRQVRLGSATAVTRRDRRYAPRARPRVARPRVARATRSACGCARRGCRQSGTGWAVRWEGVPRQYEITRSASNASSTSRVGGAIVTASPPRVSAVSPRALLDIPDA